MSVRRVAVAMATAMLLAACSKSGDAGAAGAGQKAPAAGSAGTVHIVFEYRPVNLTRWIAWQQGIQLTCLQGRRVRGLAADAPLLTWEQALAANTFKTELLATPDAALTDVRVGRGEIDSDSCRWVEKPASRTLTIAQGCQATVVDFDARTRSQSELGTPECLAKKFPAMPPRKRVDWINDQGERRVVAGQPCRMNDSAAEGTRGCVLEAMPIHPLLESPVTVLWEPHAKEVERAKLGRASLPMKEGSTVVGAGGAPLPEGLEGQASLIEVGKPVAAERFALPAEARSFKAPE